MAERPLAPTDPLADSLVQLGYLLLDEIGQATAEHEVSLTQLRLLGILRERSRSMAAIAERLRLDRSSVSGLIDRAERRGLVSRRTSAEDARVTLVDLTDAGAALTAQLAVSVSQRLDRVVAPLSARDRAELLRLTDAITE